jgi:hypothetical protein
LNRFQTPVIVAPSEEQIENAVSQTTFGEIEVPRNVHCPISLEPFLPEHNVSVIRHCGHIFVPGQLASWFTRNVRCPVCRFDIRDYPVSRDPLSRDTPPQDPLSRETPLQDPVAPPPSAAVYNFITTMEYDGDHVIFDVSSSAITETLTNLSSLLLQDLFRGTIDASMNPMRR